MSIYDDEVAELIWENGQLSMHGLGGPHPTEQEKPTLSRARDTLESVVQQGTGQHQKSKHNILKDHHHHAPTTSVVASSGDLHAVPTLSRNRAWSKFSTDTTSIMLEENCGLLLPSGGSSANATSAGATFCRDNDTTMMTWASLDSGRSFQNNKTLEEHSACHSGSQEIRDNQDERDSKAGIGQANSKRRNRTATIHNQSERKRRDRINQKMKALQKLVPNASKTDKASMLDEVINYLKQLQAQIQMMNITTSMPQMMVPLAMQQQQHLQMSMLARMGMVNINNNNNNNNNMVVPHTRSFPQLIQPTTVVGDAVTAPMFVAPSSFMNMMPSNLIQARAPAATSGTNASSIPLPHPYSASLTRSVNMDHILNMAALYNQQQMSQNNHALRSSLSQLHHGKGD